MKSYFLFILASIFPGEFSDFLSPIELFRLRLMNKEIKSAVDEIFKDEKNKEKYSQYFWIKLRAAEEYYVPLTLKKLVEKFSIMEMLEKFPDERILEKSLLLKKLTAKTKQEFKKLGVGKRTNKHYIASYFSHLYVNMESLVSFTSIDARYAYRARTLSLSAMHWSRKFDFIWRDSFKTAGDVRDRTLDAGRTQLQLAAIESQEEKDIAALRWLIEEGEKYRVEAYRGVYKKLTLFIWQTPKREEIYISECTWKREDDLANTEYIKQLRTLFAEDGEYYILRD